MFPWHVTSCASTRTVDCLMMPSVRQEGLIHPDIKEQLSLFRKKMQMFGEPMSPSAKWSGFNISRRILSTIQGWCTIECGFCLLYVRGRHISDFFFTDQCWQGQGGGHQRTGVVTVASVTMWFNAFCCPVPSQHPRVLVCARACSFACHGTLTQVKQRTGHVVLPTCYNFIVS